MTANAPGSESFAEQVFWSPHANPRSVWAFVAAYPTLILAIYRRNRPLLAATLLGVVANLLVFSPPADDDAWATRVVLGERAWLEQGVWSSPTDLAFVVLAAPVYLFTIRSAIKRQPVRTAVATPLSMALMFVFFDRMARVYDST